MRIEGDLAVALSAQVTYADMMGLTGKVLGKDLKNNTGTRKLEENGWREQDIYEIIKALEVDKNKFLILRLLPRMELFDLIYLLDKEQLLFGLMFLPRERLLQLIIHLPKQLLIRMLLYMLPLKDLIKLMPSRELFNILRSRKLTTRDLIRGLRTLPEKFLRFIMMKMTLKDTPHLSQDELAAMFNNFHKRQLLDGMRMLPFKALMPLVHFLVEQDPELLMNLSRAFIFKVMDMMPKAALVDACRVLPDDILIEFLDQLPDHFLAQVAEQVDDTMFEQYLMSEQRNLLLYLASGQDAA
jgi:Mg/Co/Ni transporter MgtE